MKKILLFSASMAIAFSGMAQRNKLSAARDAYVDDELLRAKTTIDEVVQHPETKESAEAWLLRANIYGKIIETPTVAASFPNAVYESNNSLLQAIRLNSRYDKQGADFAIERSMSYLMNRGITFYQEKQYDSAAAVFASVRSFLTAVGGAGRFNDDGERRKKLARISRNSRQFAAYSSYWKKDYVTAAAGLEELRKGMKDIDAKNGQDIYSFLILSYQALGNNEKIAEIVKEASTKYPDNEQFQNLAINVAIKSGETASILSSLESNPRLSKSADMQYALGSTYYKIAEAESRSSSADTLASAEQHYQKAEAAYRAGLALDDRASFNFGLGLLSYNRAQAMVVKMTSLGNTPADNQKYEEYSKQSKQLMNDAIPYFEKAATQYEGLGSEKLNDGEHDGERRAYRASLEALRDMYGRLENNPKRLEADKRLKALK